MRKQDFQFSLPPELIAKKPSKERSGSRLLVADPVSQSLQHKQFSQLTDFLRPNDCLIFNNTKVVPARLTGKRESGGKVEVLIERIRPATGATLNDRCIAQVRASNTPKSGARIKIATSFELEVTGREGAFFVLENRSTEPLMTLVQKHGNMPLPPYIDRKAGDFDVERYQTVYADHAGAVAAPTAGLHFDRALIRRIEEKGVKFDYVTLHVGAGTFAPIRVDDISEHKMHSEWFNLPQSVVDLVAKTRKNGGRVIAVGTTSVRCLESASRDDELTAQSGETNIFITPGYRFKSVDALITNFHLSESTLIMLVSAFAGKSFVLDIYQKAIEKAYRFFSYGDSMFFENKV